MEMRVYIFSPVVGSSSHSRLGLDKSYAYRQLVQKQMEKAYTPELLYLSVSFRRRCSLCAHGYRSWYWLPLSAPTNEDENMALTHVRAKHR